MNYITDAKYQTLRGGKTQEGDLVYCLRGATLGKTAIVDRHSIGAVASSLVVVRPNHHVLDSRFALKYLTSPIGQGLIRRFDNGSAQPNLSANSVKLYPIPLPPLAEQRRIVAKVDELMAVCDELEQSLATEQTERGRLLEALLRDALQDALPTRELELLGAR
jgi:type I restriction enzyme S subunit